MYDCDLNGIHLVFTNQFFKAMIGGDSPKLEGNIDILSFIHPQDQRRLQSEVILAAITGNALQSRFRMKGTDGKYLNVLMSAQQMDKGGAASRFYAAFLKC